MNVLLDHPDHGVLLVTNMFDIDDEETTDIEMAVRVVCLLPDGQWLATCVCPGASKLREIRSGLS